LTAGAVLRPFLGAIQAVQAVGLVATTHTITDPTCESIGEVLNESPQPGTVVPLGSTVSLGIGARPSKCPVPP